MPWPSNPGLSATMVSTMMEEFFLVIHKKIFPLPVSTQHWEMEIYSMSTMMTSSNGNIFCITGPLWGESTSHWWIPLTKASDTELGCFLWSGSEQTVMTKMHSVWKGLKTNCNITMYCSSLSHLKQQKKYTCYKKNCTIDTASHRGRL